MAVEDPDERFVKVATFDNASVAEIVRMRLEAEGIPVVMRYSAPSPFGEGHAAVWGGVRLTVRESDVERAQAILETPEASQDIATEDPEAAALDAPDDLTVRCPRCASTDHTVTQRPDRFIVFLWTLVRGTSRPAWLTPRYHCNACGHEWADWGL